MRTEFDPITHIGKVDGVVWPSSTQLLKEFGLVDYSTVPERVLENKRVLGDRVHLATLLLDSGELDEEHFNSSFPECIPYLEGYRKFRIIEHFEPVFKEQRFFSAKYKFHGAPDEVARDKNGRLVIIEYKNTWKIYKAICPQMESYRLLVEEAMKEKVCALHSLKLKPNGDYDLQEHKEPGAKMDFLHALSLHWRKRTFYK